MNFDPVIPHNPNKNDAGLVNAPKNALKGSAILASNKGSEMIASNVDSNTETKNPLRASGMLKSSMNVKGVYNPKANYKTPAPRSSASSESSAGIKEEPMISPFAQAETKVPFDQNSSHNIINIPKIGQSLPKQEENVPQPMLNPQKPIPKEMRGSQPRVPEQEEEKKKVNSQNPQLSSKTEEIKKPIEKIPSIPKYPEPSPLRIPAMDPPKNIAPKPQENPSQKSEPILNSKNPDSKSQIPENAPQKKLDISAGVKVQSSNNKPPEPEPIPQVKTEVRPKAPAPPLIPRKDPKAQEIPQVDKNQPIDKKITDESKLPEPSKEPKGAEPIKKGFEIPKKGPGAPLKKEEEEKKSIENQPKNPSLPGKGVFAIPVKKKPPAAQPEISEAPISVRLKMVPFSEFKPKGQLVQNLNHKTDLVPIMDNTEKYNIEPAELTNREISNLIDLFLLQTSKVSQNILVSEPKVAEVIAKYLEDDPRISEFFSNRDNCGDCNLISEKILLDCGVEVCKKCINKELSLKSRSLMLVTEYDNIKPLCDYCNSPYTEEEYKNILGKNYSFYSILREERSIYQFKDNKSWLGKEDAFKSARIAHNSLIPNKCKSCKKVKRLSDFYEECCKCLCKDCYATLKCIGNTVCPYCEVDLKVKDLEILCKGCNIRVNKIEMCVRELCFGHSLCMRCLKESKKNKACAYPECKSALTEVQMRELKRFFKKTQGKD